MTRAAVVFEKTEATVEIARDLPQPLRDFYKLGMRASASSKAEIEEITWTVGKDRKVGPSEDYVRKARLLEQRMTDADLRLLVATYRDQKYQFSWGHLRILVSVKYQKRRHAYLISAINDGWSAKTLIAAVRPRCERCPSAQIRRQELEQIVTTGFGKLDMKINREAVREISGLSKGLPHYAHLISLNCGRQALDSGTMLVAQEHVSKTQGRRRNSPTASELEALEARSLLTVTLLSDHYLIEQETVAATLSALQNDSAESGYLPLIIGVGTPAHGSVSIAADSQSLVFTPEPSFLGSDSFTYSAQDPFPANPEEAAQTTTVDVTIYAADDALNSAHVLGAAVGLRCPSPDSLATVPFQQSMSTCFALSSLRVIDSRSMLMLSNLTRGAS